MRVCRFPAALRFSSRCYVCGAWFHENVSFIFFCFCFPFVHSTCVNTNAHTQTGQITVCNFWRFSQQSLSLIRWVFVCLSVMRTRCFFNLHAFHYKRTLQNDKHSAHSCPHTGPRFRIRSLICGAIFVSFWISVYLSPFSCALPGHGFRSTAASAFWCCRLHAASTQNEALQWQEKGEKRM